MRVSIWLQSWALPIQVSIFRYSILIGYRKNYRNIGLKKYRNIKYRIANFYFRYSDTVSKKRKKYRTKSIENEGKMVKSTLFAFFSNHFVLQSC
jgi:hypothetical protein